MENKSEKKNMFFKWMGAATWTLQIDDLRIASDPCLCDKGTVQDFTFFKAKRIDSPACRLHDFDDINLWLITHNHEDHIDKGGASKIEPSSEVVTHRNAIKKLKHVPKDHLHILDWHQTKKLRLEGFEIEITAIPAVHGSNFISAFLAGGVNGYWLKISKADFVVNIYITGDTVNHPKVTKVVAGSRPDVLIANLGGVNNGSFGGPLTFTVQALAEFSNLVLPKLTVPIHFHTFSHYTEPIEDLKLTEEQLIVPVLGEMVDIAI
jgi:N-acyl-phosphatidylethanolamine-hydrolysing phospholipase D